MKKSVLLLLCGLQSSASESDDPWSDCTYTEVGSREFVHWKGKKNGKIKYYSEDSAMIKFNFFNNKESYDLTAEDYTGFLVFSKKLCGIDLLEKINDGRVTVSINDYGAYYSTRAIYLRVDKSHSNTVIQVTRKYLSDEKDLPDNNIKKDTVWIAINGLKDVDFGNKDWKYCIESIQAGTIDAKIHDINADHSVCAAWDIDLGYQSPVTVPATTSLTTTTTTTTTKTTTTTTTTTTSTTTTTTTSTTDESACSAYWETAPWDFGGKNQGRLWGEGLEAKGCLDMTEVDQEEHHVNITTSETFQEMVGFGAAMSGSSAWLIFNSTKRDELMHLLFAPIEQGGAGISLVRLPISLLSDFVVEEPYVYVDNNDLSLESFSIEKDRAYYLPVLKQAKEINPGLKFIASAWSAPKWMKKSKSLNGGWFDDQYQEVYAKYLAKYLEAYKAEGLEIEFITPGNEPGHGAGGYPTMKMTATSQAAFVPLLKKEIDDRNLNTKIVIYDHNWDNLDFPREILNSTAADSVYGTAFHCYGGNYQAPGILSQEFPSKSIFFTECTGHGEDDEIWAPNPLKWNQEKLFIGQPFYGNSRSVTLWNLVLDETKGPNLSQWNCPEGKFCGCDHCRGIITLAGEEIRKNIDYYAVAHSSAFVKPGFVRVRTEGSEKVLAVSYKKGNQLAIVLQAKFWQSKSSITVSVDGKVFKIPQVAKTGAVTVRMFL